MSIILCTLTHDALNYNIEFGAGFESNTVPNFSNLKHFENRCIIENIPIKKAQADKEVYEFKSNHFEYNKK